MSADLELKNSDGRPALVAVEPELSAGSWPVFASNVSAGFPSPADDYIESRIDLNEHLIQHKEATFFLRVQGDSMTGMGILNDDLLVVDRSLPVETGNIVIAAIDGEFTVKQLLIRQGTRILKAAHPAYRDIVIDPEGDLEIWGVVRWAIHKLWP
ncbi:MAG: translesion error-prone DNA polymerase V autoproteolytic subunit [Candidatus Nitrohelix vancouverensis]|uniref:Translesion error-prone DNA polymerase V autoproteolytic subunit n=1 Tax=Candidatus Nitrohelix vancouverensis TaxID=2705534 RepID=A0A7T0C188_9BACT|nr:MAG: translesion error-prone DNA polymerase V autoproteolytic subunit [Candidatus Nitrohelix vancouverensis]